MKCLLPLAMLLLIPIARGQHISGTKLKIKESHEEIVLEGVLNEKAWEEADIAENWYQNFPLDSLPAPFQTEARMTLNDEFVNVSLVCYDDNTPDVVSTLRRDLNYALNDNISFIFKPYHDCLNWCFLMLTLRGQSVMGLLRTKYTLQAFTNIII